MVPAMFVSFVLAFVVAVNGLHLFITTSAHQTMGAVITLLSTATIWPSCGWKWGVTSAVMLIIIGVVMYFVDDPQKHTC